MSSTVLIIAGTTASGKSALAMDLAKELNGVVINADSMQVYRDLPILSAAPSAADRAVVEHRLYEIYDPAVTGTVVDWLNLAVSEIRACQALGRTAIVVGGTGLYLDNLINGTTPIPEPEAHIRARVRLIAEHEGVDGVFARLQKIDPIGAAELHGNDITRVSRAYEVMVQTGKSIAEWYQIPRLKKMPEANFKVIKLLPEKSELDQRCYLRFDQMMQNGALREAKNMFDRHLDPNLPAMKMLGLPELIQFILGRCSFEEAVELAKLHTRQYAKRQRTWFNNKPEGDLILTHCYTQTNKVLINDVKKIISCCAIGD